MDTLAIAILLATANKALLDFIAAPLRRRWPELDLWWFDYVGLGLGGVIAWFAEVNVFMGLIQNAMVGRVLTALLVGGGTALINQVMATAPDLAGVHGVRDVRGFRRPRGW